MYSPKEYLLVDTIVAGVDTVVLPRAIANGLYEYFKAEKSCCCHSRLDPTASAGHRPKATVALWHLAAQLVGGKTLTVGPSLAPLGREEGGQTPGVRCLVTGQCE